MNEIKWQFKTFDIIRAKEDDTKINFFVVKNGNRIAKTFFCSDELFRETIQQLSDLFEAMEKEETDFDWEKLEFPYSCEEVFVGLEG